MPIYEYVCSHCGHRFEKLVRNFGHEQQVHCPRCRENGSQRLLSSFAVSRQSAPARVGGG